jgi:YfiH family protein
MTLPVPIECEWLAGHRSGLAHGFFTRRGGVSKGIYDGLNLGLGTRDSRVNVMENRARVADALRAPNILLATPHQIHSDIVVEVDEPWQPDDRPHGDAVVTRRAGVVLGVLTADCGPVLFADMTARVIAAAHAGWKGAIGGILENTIAAMEKLGASRNRITATLGPTISQANYEIGADVIERLRGVEPAADQYFAPSANEGRALFDLPGFIVDRLVATGVRARWTGECTYGEEARFYSYRRMTHRKEPDYGRQISAIMLKG